MTKLTSSEQLLKRLKNTLLKQRLVLFSSGLLMTATAVVAAAIGLSLLANVMILPVWLKVTLLVAVGAVSLVIFGRFALARLFSGSPETVAITLEKKHTDMKGRLIAAIQFAKLKEDNPYSRELIEATERQALQRAGSVNFNRALTYHPMLRTGRFFIVAAVIGSAMVGLVPGLFSYSYEVFSNPTTEIAPPLAYKVVAYPGTAEWVKYKDIEIGAEIFGDRLPDKATVYHRFVDGQWQKAEIDLNKVRHAALENGDSVKIGVTLRQVNKSFDYYVEAGRLSTEVQQVDVVDRPRVNGIKLSIFYPEYTGLEPTVINENEGSFSAVVGSRVNMALETNLPVESAELVFDDTSRTPLEVNGRTAETSLRVDKSHSYHIRLRDHLGEKNPDPIQYHLTAVPDEYPSIDVLQPGVNVNLSDQMILPLKVRIYDDYGFSSLVLKYTVVNQGRAGEENVAVLHFSDRIKTEGEVAFNWDMDKLNMFPGDFTIYHFEVADNDMISGPKMTKSRQFVARIPSLEEIIAEAEGRGAERIDHTEQLLNQGKDLSERFKKMARKLQAQNRDAMKAEWQHQKELQALTEKNEELIENIEKMAEEMDKGVEELSKQSQHSREIVEKMQQIQKLFEEVATPEMKEAQKKLMEALEKMDRNEIQKAMEEFQLSQEELLERLERQLALLKQLQMQQKMESMMRKAEQLLERQDKMNETTENSPSESLPKMAEQEAGIKEDLEQLKKEVEELRKLMEEAEMSDNEQAKKFAESVEKTDADQNMENMQKQMQQQQKETAGQEGQKASSKLSQMLGQMQEQFAAMTQQQDDMAKKMMRNAIEDANYLSRSQEELLKKAAEMNPTSDALKELAKRQQDLAGSCQGLKNRIAELGQASPFVAAELQQLVEQATAQMELSMRGMGEKRGLEAQRAQHDAMVKLNKASLRLMESMNEQKQCESGANCNKNMAQMESLSQQQQKLNDMTQQQCENPGMNPGSQGEAQAARDGLKRLAGEQASIRKSMEQLAEEFGDSRQILGRLKDLSDEMKKVEEALSSGEVGAETTERQLKIYSRMLQATRSLQRRDYTEQRQAETPTEQVYQVPPSLPAELLNDRTNLEDRLRRYLGDSYPRQYEEQIKAYFKALLNVESTPPQTESAQ